MIKSQGKSYLKQYMPLKLTKRGIKVWVAVDSTNGYFSQFEVYTGKKDNSTEHGLGARVVKTLTSDFKGKYNHVYFDNFFTSLQLEKDQIYLCGTTRKTAKAFQISSRSPTSRIGVCCEIVCVYTCTCNVSRYINAWACVQVYSERACEYVVPCVQ